MPVYNQNAAGFRVFQDSRQGGRKYMEDIVCINSHKSENGEHDFLYFAIFDGHGGAVVDFIRYIYNIKHE